MIRAGYDIKRRDFRLRLELELSNNGISAIFGPSGSGKTTLLRAIVGLERHPDGYLKIADNILQDKNTFVPTHKRNITLVPQEPELFAHLSVKQNIEYGFKRMGKQKPKINQNMAIAWLKLENLLDRMPATLSGGEKQRVAIARSIAANPQVLLMDEPLSGLDSTSKHNILSYLESLHHNLNLPIIYVSHSVNEVARLADYMVLLDQGKIVGSGKTEDIFSRLDLPLSQGEDAAALINTRVIEHDDKFQLSYLEFPGGTISIPQTELKVGSIARIRIAARDVSLTLKPQTDTSILNIFPGLIEEIKPDGSAQVMLRLNANGTPILCKITNKSLNQLKLKPGIKVFAQVKSVALLS